MRSQREEQSPRRSPRGNRRRGRSSLPRPSLAEIRGGSARVLRRALPAAVAIGVSSISATAGFAGYRWLTTSPHFAVSDIRIEGGEHLGEGAAGPLESLLLGHNLFRIDLAAVERALSGHPWVASAELSRRWPSAVDVFVREHVAAAAIDLGGLYLVDAEGRVFKRTSVLSGETEDLPIITGLLRADYLASPARAEATLRRALLLAKSYQAVPDRPRLGGIALEGPDGTTLVTYERAIAIRFGDLGPHEVGPRLAAFDRAWRALNADEREAAHSLRIAETDRVTVAFGGMDQPWRR